MYRAIFFLLFAPAMHAEWLSSVSTSIDLVFPPFEILRTCSDPNFCLSQATIGLSQVSMVAEASGSGNSGSARIQFLANSFPGHPAGAFDNAVANASVTFWDELMITGSSGTFTFVEATTCQSDYTGGIGTGAFASIGGGCPFASVQTETVHYLDGIPFQSPFVTVTATGFPTPDVGNFGNGDAIATLRMSGFIGTPDNLPGVYSRSGLFGAQAALPEPSTWLLAAAGLSAVLILRRRRSPR